MIFRKFCLFVAVCAFAAACLKPKKNCGFVVLRAYQQCAIVGAQNIEKTSKKLTKNPSETTSEPFKNRCQKYVVFGYRFLQVLASISEGLGPPRRSQVGSVGLQNLRIVPPKSPLKLDVWQKWRLGGFRARFGGPRASIFKGFGDDLSRCSCVLGVRFFDGKAEPKVHVCCTFLAVGPGAVDCRRQLGLGFTAHSPSLKQKLSAVTWQRETDSIIKSN